MRYKNVVMNGLGKHAYLGVCLSVYCFPILLSKWSTFYRPPPPLFLKNLHPPSFLQKVLFIKQVLIIVVFVYLFKLRPTRCWILYWILYILYLSSGIQKKSRKCRSLKVIIIIIIIFIFKGSVPTPIKCVSGISIVSPVVLDALSFRFIPYGHFLGVPELWIIPAWMITSHSRGLVLWRGCRLIAYRAG
jgi:hypothetical protein